MGTINPFRARADVAELRARKATDPEAKTEWTMIAIEWHAVAARADGEQFQPSDIRQTELAATEPKHRSWFSLSNLI